MTPSCSILVRVLQLFCCALQAQLKDAAPVTPIIAVSFPLAPDTSALPVTTFNSSFVEAFKSLCGNYDLLSL